MYRRVTYLYTYKMTCYTVSGTDAAHHPRDDALAPSTYIDTYSLTSPLLLSNRRQSTDR